MATECTAIIDVDSAIGGFDYTSLDAWEDDLGSASTPAVTSGDLAGNDQIAIAQCANSSGSADTAAVAIQGWTTDPTRYIKIEAYTGYRHVGVYTASKYHITSTDVVIIGCTENYVRVDGIQLGLTVTANNNGSCFQVQGVNAGGSDIQVSNCILNAVSMAGTGFGRGFQINDTDVDISIWNCIAYGFVSGADAGFIAAFLSCNTAKLYNCTISGSYRGVFQSAGTVDVYNCAVFNNTSDFEGAFNSINECATDQGAGEGNNGVDISGTWDSTCFTDAGGLGPDWSLQDALSPLYQTGDGTEAKAVFTEDIVGTTMGPADGDWPIGAFEFVAAGGLSIPGFFGATLHPTLPLLKGSNL